MYQSPVPLVNQTRVCIVLPPKVQSKGLWKGLAVGGNDDWLSFSLPRVEMIITLMFAISYCSHYFLKRFGIPLFTSQLIAGLALSPAVLGNTIGEKLVTDESVKGIGAIGSLGFTLFVFLAGIQMDPSMVTRVNRSAFYNGFLAVIPSMVFAITVLEIFSDNDEDKGKSFLITPSYITSSFPVITGVLSELKILNSELGRTAQCSAMVSGLLSLFIFMTSNLLKESAVLNGRHAIHDLIVILAFLVIVLLVLRPAIQLVIKYTPEGKPVNQVYITIIILLFLICISAASYSGTLMLGGPYLLGLAIPHGPPVGSAVVEKLETMVNIFLLPVFVSTCGMRAEKLVIEFQKSLTIVNAFTVAIACLVKFGSCLLPPLYYDMPLKDTFALALIMSSKGVLELAMIAYFNDIKLIDGELFCFLFYVVMFMSIIVPILVKRLYDPSRKYASYSKRNIIDIKSHGELPIVACIHVPENVSAVINLLDAACPSQESPIAVNVLHLIKLRGQAAPIFISHQKKRRAMSAFSYSENIIIAFSKFEGTNFGAVSVNNFTAVSSPNFMQDDICTLALDKLASLIVLPFHRRWYIDGSIESDDEVIRILNCRILEKSPCSVGILVDRGNIRRPPLSHLPETEFNVANIFIGGPDDREAITFAKRMALNTRVRLTVVHLVAVEGEANEIEDWGPLYDVMTLRDVKTNGYINYIEKKVHDGPETATILRSMINEFNLIIVGRREKMESPQTSGLEEWSEFPELGALGDLLASTDYHGRCSVFVVQQQHTSY